MSTKHNTDKFNILLSNVRKFNVDLASYVAPKIGHFSTRKFARQSNSIVSFNEKEQEKSKEQILALQKCSIEEFPKICTWLYMKEPELDQFMKLKQYWKVKEAIANKIPDEFPQGISRILITEMIYGIRKFCIDLEFSLEKSGAAISLFYITHREFTSNSRTSAEEIFGFFKERLIYHCISSPPESVKIFSAYDARKLTLFFCSFYLRYLPLIRALSLPNFGLRLMYPLQPEMPKSKKKDKKGKKDKKKKKGKKDKSSKKSSKKSKK